MNRRPALFLLSSLTIYITSAFPDSGYPSLIKKIDPVNNKYFHVFQATNHPPKVKIISPANNSSYPWNSRISYSISVSDPEDGDSRYDEIQAKEVFLEIKYLPGETDITGEMTKDLNDEPEGFTIIKSSNCANCHLFKTKLIGPSYSDISHRYQHTKANEDLLVKRIMEGTSGVWGNVKMPSHPELNLEDTHKIVQWIQKNGSDPNLDYLSGIDGSIQLSPPAGSGNKGIFMLTASYTDHGTTENPKQHITGRDVIAIRPR